MPDRPLRVTQVGLTVAVRLTLRAKANGLTGIVPAAEGRRVLTAVISAHPIKTVRLAGDTKRLVTKKLPDIGRLSEA